MDYLQEAVRNFNKDEHGVRNLALANTAAAIAQVEELRGIRVALAALVELGGRNMVDIVGDGDFTDGLDDEGELSF